MAGKRRLIPLAAGTFLVLAAGGVYWSLSSATREKAGPAAPAEAHAEIVITPGNSARPATRKTSGIQNSRDRQPPVTEKSRSTSETQLHSDKDESWSVIYLDDQRIGWSSTSAREVQVDRRTVLRTTAEVQMNFKRFGQNVEMRKTTITDETLDGDLLSYTMELQNPPAASTLTTGTIRGEELIVESNVGGRTQTTRIPWDPSVKSPTWEDRQLRKNPLRPGGKRSFRTFVPDLNKVSTVRVVADDYQMARMLDGSERKLLKTRTTQSVLPEMTTRGWVDDSGRTLRTEDDMLGRTMVIYKVTREEALKKMAGAELDIAVNTLISTGAISNPYKTTKAVYRITLTGDDPAKYLVADATQAVTRVSADTVELTVLVQPLPRNVKDVPIDEVYSQPTQFLQSNDPAVVEHARKAVPTRTNPQRAAMQMEQYVHRIVKKKNFSTALASAAEVAKSLEGDCTEHAVLLAAMLRSGGIPSRVAVGLVYVDGAQAFGGHMWTEAWIGGQWYPLDATLGRGQIDAVHIKLSESSFDDDAPAPVTTFLPLIRTLGKMKIQVVESR